ncbi:hypothetical protein [Shimia biformata]|uniref:hypothetical protein n=1 Tax=Shimia biformata TaxID=1294299 RepID=UPI00194EDF5E|nr:hypothetical protein [Shimia biformata]
MGSDIDPKAEIELLRAQLELAQMMLERETRARIALEKQLAAQEEAAAAQQTPPEVEQG